MSDRMLSPDGQFMWTGTEWIPAPPSSEGNQINMQDSVMSGDIVRNTVINNDPAVVTAAGFTALQQVGMPRDTLCQQSPPPPEI